MNNSEKGLDDKLRKLFRKESKIQRWKIKEKNKDKGPAQTNNDLFHANNKERQRERTEKMERRKSPIK